MAKTHGNLSDIHSYDNVCKMAMLGRKGLKHWLVKMETRLPVPVLKHWLVKTRTKFPVLIGQHMNWLIKTENNAVLKTIIRQIYLFKYTPLNNTQSHNNFTLSREPPSIDQRMVKMLTPWILNPAGNKCSFQNKTSCQCITWTKALFSTRRSSAKQFRYNNSIHC